MLRSVQIAVLIMVVLSTDLHSQQDTLHMDLTGELTHPKQYAAPHTSESICIDGLPDDAAWRTTSFSDRFVDIESGEAIKYDTRVKMLWSRDYLYIFAYLQEPHVWGTLRQRDTVIFYNNDFEVFIDPSGDTYNYCEIEINALGTEWDLLLDKPYRLGGRASTDYNIDGLKTAVHVIGTVNDAGDTDTAWTVEMAIPMQALAALKAKPQTVPEAGEVWRINFSRVQWEHEIRNGKYYRRKENGKFLPEMNWVWSPQGVINMHVPEKWGYLIFVHAAKDGHSIQVEDAHTQQIAFALFRAVRFGRHKEWKDWDVGDSAVVIPSKDHKTCTQAHNVRLKKTRTGFEISLVSPVTNKHYVIDQDGHYREL